MPMACTADRNGVHRLKALIERWNHLDHEHLILREKQAIIEHEMLELITALPVEQILFNTDDRIPLMRDAGEIIVE